MLPKNITENYIQTQKIGQDLAKEIIKNKPQKKAVVLFLKGNLGSGKTTFLQGFSKGLEIKEKILSPTFVIMKRFKIKKSQFENFYHFDCYRLKNNEDLDLLEWKEIIKNPKNIIAVEWPEKIKKVLQKNTITIEFRFIEENKREINLKIC